MRRECCLGKGVDGGFRLACGLAIAMAVAVSVVGGLSGCIRVSPYFEIEHCVDRFIDAAVAGDLWAVRELTVERPEGWERAIEAVASAWSSSEIVDAERSGDRALVRVVSEARASSIGGEAGAIGDEAGWTGEAGAVGGGAGWIGEVSPASDEAGWAGEQASAMGDELSATGHEASGVSTRRSGRSEWIIELVRIEGIWLVDLGRTLAPE